jgi:hypothetical protein
MGLATFGAFVSVPFATAIIAGGVNTADDFTCWHRRPLARVHPLGQDQRSRSPKNRVMSGNLRQLRTGAFIPGSGASRGKIRRKWPKSWFSIVGFCSSLINPRFDTMRFSRTNVRFDSTGTHPVRRGHFVPEHANAAVHLFYQKRKLYKYRKTSMFSGACALSYLNFMSEQFLTNG